MLGEMIGRYAPFIYRRESEWGYRVDTKGILQAIIIAALTGAVTLYSTQQVILSRFDSMDMKIHDLSNRIDKLRDDLYIPKSNGNSKAKAIRTFQPAGICLPLRRV